MVEFTHIQNERAQMVDISGKGDVLREAIAAGKIYLRPETLAAIREGTIVKGNVLATARVAATIAVKNTSNLIPMCHSIPISSVSIDFKEGSDFIEATVVVKMTGKTGVEMEALTGVSVALLTVWDMVKSAEKDSAGQYPVTAIADIRVLEKKKGKCHDLIEHPGRIGKEGDFVPLDSDPEYVALKKVSLKKEKGSERKHPSKGAGTR